MDMFLPRRLDGSALTLFVQRFANGCAQGQLPGELNLNLSLLDFIEPVGVTFLSNFLHWLHSQGVRLRLSGTDNYSNAMCFLDDSLFFEQHAGHKLKPDARVRGTTRPLVRIQHQDSFAWLRGNLVPWLANALGVNHASLYPLQTCIAEIFNNINDHSSLTQGSTFVQHFPRLNVVRAAIADFGYGIPTVVRRQLPDLSDTAAIVQAVQEGFTTRSTRGNAEYGLHYLLSTVVGTNRGTVDFYSSKGHVSFHNDGTGIASRASALNGFCPGTTIDISFRTDTIVHEADESEELEW